MAKKCVRIIGDIHGRQSDYLNWANGAEYSVQIGDMGFSYEHLKELDVSKHKWFPGNHDQYNLCFDEPHCLGNFGTINFLSDSFFMRGGFSLDWRVRVPGLNWWMNEELSWVELETAFEEYCRIKPKIMLSHECPLSIVPLITDGRIARNWGYPDIIETRTNVTLERMLKEHRPNLWVFAHFHRDFNQLVDHTLFVCLTSDTSYNCTNRFLDLPLDGANHAL